MDGTKKKTFFKRSSWGFPRHIEDWFQVDVCHMFELSEGNVLQITAIGQTLDKSFYTIGTNIDFIYRIIKTIELKKKAKLSFTKMSNVTVAKCCYSISYWPIGAVSQVIVFVNQSVIGSVRTPTDLIQSGYCLLSKTCSCMRTRGRPEERELSKGGRKWSREN